MALTNETFHPRSRCNHGQSGTRCRQLSPLIKSVGQICRHKRRRRKELCRTLPRRSGSSEEPQSVPAQRSRRPGAERAIDRTIVQVDHYFRERTRSIGLAGCPGAALRSGWCSANYDNL
jgi:hypothetical protein